MIGITQGFITSVLLFKSNEKRLGKKILGFMLIAFGLVNCKILLHTLGLWNVNYLRYFPLGFELFLPPLVYFYISSLIVTNFKWTKKTSLHLIPGFAVIIYDSIIYSLALLESSYISKDAIATSFHFDNFNAIEDYLILVSTLVYLVFAYSKLNTFIKWIKQFESYKSFALYKWLRFIFIWMTILGLVLLTNEVLDEVLMPGTYSWRWRLFNLIVAFITYYLGFMGYKQDDKKLYDSKLNLEGLFKKLTNSKITSIESQIKQQLDKQKIYLDPDLNAKLFADELGITVKDLSFVINNKFNQSFRDLINLYRVDAVKQKLNNIEQRLSILDLALDCGFNSQASFYRAFKKIEGVTPKQYLSSQSK
jgi:AraC-like DNA-binding protein